MTRVKTKRPRSLSVRGRFFSRVQTGGSGETLDLRSAATGENTFPEAGHKPTPCGMGSADGVTMAGVTGGFEHVGPL